MILSNPELRYRVADSVLSHFQGKYLFVPDRVLGEDALDMYVYTYIAYTPQYCNNYSLVRSRNPPQISFDSCLPNNVYCLLVKSH